MKTCKSFARDGKGNDGRTEASRRKLDNLLRRYAGQALSFARGLAGNEDEARELVQEASCHVLRNWKRYDPLKSFQNWYLSMVKNLYIDARRAWSQRPTFSLDAPIPGTDGLCWSDTVADGEPGPLEQLERGQRIEAARRAIKSLSDEHKAVLTLCDLQGVSYEETARKLGIPTGTVRSRLARARAFLRRDPDIRRMA